MIKLTLKLVTLLLVTMVSFQSSAAGKSELSILYVGDDPENIIVTKMERQQIKEKRYMVYRKARTPDFVKFLSANFNKVKLVHSQDYVEKLSDDYDVTIFGNAPTLLKESALYRDSKGKITSYDTEVYLSKDFSKASLMLAEVSATIGQSLESKIDWHCLCLDSHAHGMKLKHPIFNTPNKVELTIESRKTPEHYTKYFSGKDLPKTLPMWRAQVEGFADGKGYPAGMVSSGPNFDNAPDSEIIANGDNTKAAESVALGRHGSLFHWGFSAIPSDMTAEARLVFINAIHYIAKFKGEKRYSIRKHRKTTRQVALDTALSLQDVSFEVWKKNSVAAYQHNQKLVLDKKAKGKKLSFIDKRILHAKNPASMDKKSWILKKALAEQPKELIEELGTDLMKYLPYYIDNLEYLMATDNAYLYKVDEDAQSLATSNRKVESLNRWISLYENDEEIEKVKRLLLRYTHQSFNSASQWRDWYKKNKDKFYFSEINQYKFEITKA